MSVQVYDHDRARTFLHFYTNGATLQEIGDAFGISRERVRQVLVPFGVRGELRTTICPLRALSVARKAPAFSTAAQILGVTNQSLRVCLIELGAWPALERLWGWRARDKRRTYTDAHLLDLLRALATRLGRTPTLHEVAAEHGTWPTVYYLRFGSMREAMRRAGLVGRSTGGPGHLGYSGSATTCGNGHDLTAPDAVYWTTTKRGKRCRKCRACIRKYSRARYARIRAGA